MKPTILLAEDDPDVLKMTKARLEHEGFDVVPVTDGEEALTRATGGSRVDVILLDIRLPRLDGYQLCARLKRHPVTASVPIIVFTGSESYWGDLTDQCAELGVFGWIKKPFRSQELVTKIREALAKTPGERHDGKDSAG